MSVDTNNREELTSFRKLCHYPAKSEHESELIEVLKVWFKDGFEPLIKLKASSIEDKEKYIDIQTKVLERTDKIVFLLLQSEVYRNALKSILDSWEPCEESDYIRELLILSEEKKASTLN
ncbi:hypothetical protein [Vibrio maerlii]|uniref:hypothetical protein n=1 Tax=Vibrio maerlii TaxID=2231648 RepID=UPI000E3C606E|nr:hypothetical protein [Vibrio maerlii]